MEISKWKQHVIEAKSRGYNHYPGIEHILFMMTCSDASNLLDILVIDEPFYWDAQKWIKILTKYDVNRVMIDLNATNGDKMLDEFLKAGFHRTEEILSHITGRGFKPIKGVILER
ncbi:MAG: hypothetical protein ACI4C7_00025 [Clostridia bacterium]